MPSALIMGFEYRVPIGMTSLSGVIIDMYRTYQYCLSVGITEITVMTDISVDVKMTELLPAMRDEIIDSQINTFITLLQERKQLQVLSHTDPIFRFQAIIEGCILKSTKQFVYYTGHGIDEAIVLPSGDHLPIRLLRDSIVERCDPRAEIFWVMDCCHPSHLHLPFVLVQREGEGKESSRYKLRDKLGSYTPRQDIICIGGADVESYQSIMTDKGSIFSGKLLDLFKAPRRYIPYVQAHLMQDKVAGRKFHIGVYSSHPDIYWIWQWLVPTSIEVNLQYQFVRINNYA